MRRRTSSTLNDMCLAQKHEMLTSELAHCVFLAGEPFLVVIHDGGAA